MYITGNILLAGAALSWLLILKAFYGTDPGHGPDAGTGMGMAVFFLSLIFWITLAIVLMIAARSGGLAWVPLPENWQIWGALAILTGACWLVVLSGFQYVNGQAPSGPLLIQTLTRITPAILPLACLSLAALSFFPGFRAWTGEGPILVLGWSLAIPVATANLALAGFWLTTSLQQGQQIRQESIQRDEQQTAIWLDEIERADPRDPSIAGILTFTTPFRDPILREKALAKLKENPDWPDMLARLAAGNASLEALNYLAFHDVPDPAGFAPTLDTAIRSVAAYIERNIREAGHPSELYPDRFRYDTEKCLLAADRMKNSNHDLLPAISALRTSLDTDREKRDVSFHAEEMIEKWLRKNQKR